MNILLTTLSTLPPQLNMNYYHYQGMFCTGISQQEAGTKSTIYSLSSKGEQLDKIVIIGSNVTIHDNDTRNIEDLVHYSFEEKNIHELSPYSLYLYRIQEFLQNKDKEFDEQDKPMNTDILDLYLKEKGILVTDFIEKTHSNNLQQLAGKEFNLFKNEIYDRIPNSKKMRNNISNLHNIQVVFVPSQIQIGNLSIDNISGIINEITEYNGIVNLFIDMQGGARTDIFVRNSVLSILNNDANENIHVKALFATDYNYKWAINNVVNESSRYKISDLVSGMDAFLRYGKVDQLYDYVENNTNDRIGYLLDIMKDIDEALSLCDVQKLELTIQELREYFEEGKIEVTDSISDIFSILENDIKKDYEDLLSGEKLDDIQLIKWAIRKKFYQQALTIIEARFPRILVEDGIYFYAKKQNKEQVIQTLQVLYSKTKPYERYKFDDIDHYYIKYYEKAIKSNPELPKIRPMTLSKDVKKVDKLKKIYFSLSRMRNESNHSVEKGRTSLEDVVKTMKRLLEIHDELRKEIKPKKSPSISIPSNLIKR